jgi:hypothetical protein
MSNTVQSVPAEVLIRQHVENKVVTGMSVVLCMLLSGRVAAAVLGDIA